VIRVIAAISSDLARLDPADAAYFRARERAFETTALARYRSLVAEIRARYRGVAVGYSESIFQPLGEALGLRLLTPYSFAKAIAEGTDVTAADKQTVDRQAQRRLIKVWVFNSQNVTPDVQRANQLARAAGIPVATVTETLSPASDSFQQWQVSELERLRRALARATGR
jgi:zinc/manganese transport system substrate-binding protein